MAKGVLKRTEGAARSLEVLDWRHEDAVALFKMRIAEVNEEERKLLEKAAELLGLELD